jgi:SulP family sulfate permease
LYATGRTLILCGAREQPALLMRKAEFHAHVGDANICLDLDDALERAKVLLAERKGPAAGA